MKKFNIDIEEVSKSMEALEREGKQQCLLQSIKNMLV